MKKIYLVLFTAALATTFAACSKDDATTAITSYEEIVKAQPVPVEFGTYVSESATTRDGAVGNMNNANLQTSGFGVFAYYTQNSDYPDTNDSKYPNFMYNQQLQYTNGGTSDTSFWWYTPVKFWPNDYNAGNVDTQTPTNATGANADKLSFFAYAPYVAVTQNATPTNVAATADAATGSGIIGLFGNEATADPKVTYKAATANTIGSAVDLLWGVTSTTNTYTTAAGGTFEGTVGLPLKNLVKQRIGGKVNFAFKHALVGLNLTAQGAYNEATPGANTLIPDATFIHIDEVVITSTTMNESGVLNLNNTVANTPKWETLTAPTPEDTEYTFRLSNDKIIPNLRYTSGQAVGDINSGVGRNAAGNAAIAKPQQVIDGNIDNAEYTSATYNKVFLLLPTTENTTFTVTVTYYVRTKDANLKGGYSEVKNVITKNLTINVPAGGTYALEGNKVYTINMIFGLTNVNFEASVTEWGDNSQYDVYLPKNTESN